MKGLIAAAGRSTRMQDYADRQNKVLLDLGGDNLLGTILTNFERAGIAEPLVLVGHDAFAVQHFCGLRATCLLNPFYEHHGILGSVWLAQPYLDGQAFTFTTGDHFFAFERFQTFLADQPDADILVDVELKDCDDEDMKVVTERNGDLRTMSKAFVKGGIVLGEFTGCVRFSADGSTQFFESLRQQVWKHGIQGYVADVLCRTNRKWPLAFHLSDDHRRIEVDFPYDLDAARRLFRKLSPRLTG
jgi:choline kinase